MFCFPKPILRGPGHVSLLLYWIHLDILRPKQILLSARTEVFKKHKAGNILVTRE